MKIVLQRVTRASVMVDNHIVGSIGHGLLLLVGIENADGDDDIEWLCQKIVKIRLFNDSEGVMNLPILSLADTGILVVSQFTLMASTRKGNRPSYIRAARPEIAVTIYERFVQRLNQLFGRPVQTGQFGADMQVELVNDGPVTIIIDSKDRL